MRAFILAAVALLGSLLLAHLALQSVQAATIAPDLKSALGMTHGLMLVRGGGGHMGGGMGGGHMDGMMPMSGTSHMAGVGHMGPDSADAVLDPSDCIVISVIRRSSSRTIAFITASSQRMSSSLAAIRTTTATVIG